MTSGYDIPSEERLAAIDAWLRERQIEDVECMLPDMAGIARGKSMQRQKFIEGMREGGLKLPETVFSMTINGDYAYNDFLPENDRDVILLPDLDTLCLTPWQPEPTAMVICDCSYLGGGKVELSSRRVLQRVIDLYKARGWQPIVAPEFEFYLLSHREGLEGRPVPPIGQSGRRTSESAPYSIDSLDEFAPYFDEVYDACEAQNINIDTLIHEAGASQFEFNVVHGPAMDVADQSFKFKRVVRQVAIRHNLFASFMASPYADTFGSAMHLHQSVEDQQTGRNIFANADGSDSALFKSHIAGLQKYLPDATAVIAPYVNSYRRFGSGWSSPTNLHWGRENRSVGLRVPIGLENARRVENRLAGSDVNPHLAVAVSLACGYLGMIEGLEPTPEYTGSAYEVDGPGLPQHFLDGLDALRNSPALIDVLGEPFVTTYIQIKEMEYASYSAVLSPWETNHLMLTV